MAARRRRYVRARTIYRRARGRRSSGMGGLKPLIDGFLAGAGGQVAQKYIGPYGHPVAAIGVGWFRRNPVLKIVGARELGAMVASQFVGNGGGIGGVGQ